jgi:hypothetical protein
MLKKQRRKPLESVTQIPREQIPSGKEVTNELLDGNPENKTQAKKHVRKR